MGEQKELNLIPYKIWRIEFLFNPYRFCQFKDKYILRSVIIYLENGIPYYFCLDFMLMYNFKVCTEPDIPTRLCVKLASQRVHRVQEAKYM